MQGISFDCAGFSGEEKVSKIKFWQDIVIIALKNVIQVSFYNVLDLENHLEMLDLVLIKTETRKWVKEIQTRDQYF